MIALFLAALGLFLFALNTTIMFRPLQLESPSVQSRSRTDPSYAAKIQEVLDANAIWREVGRGYQFLSVPFQGLILFVTMVLHYFGYLGSFGAYVSIGLLAAILAVLLSVRPKITGQLDMQASGSTTVRKMLRLGVRSSISFAAMIFIVCIMI